MDAEDHIFAQPPPRGVYMRSITDAAISDIQGPRGKVIASQAVLWKAPARNKQAQSAVPPVTLHLHSSAWPAKLRGAAGCPPGAVALWTSQSPHPHPASPLCQDGRRHLTQTAVPTGARPQGGRAFPLRTQGCSCICTPALDPPGCPVRARLRVTRRPPPLV